MVRVRGDERGPPQADVSEEDTAVDVLAVEQPLGAAADEIPHRGPVAPEISGKTQSGPKMDSTTSSRPSRRSALWRRFAAVAWRGSSMRRTTLSSTPRRRANASRDRPLSRNASTSAALAAIAGGTATRCSPARRALGRGIGSPSTIRPAMASSRASPASVSASASSLPDVRHSGRSRNDTRIVRRRAPVDPLRRLVGLLPNHIDVDAYLEETRGPAWQPELDGGEGNGS